MKVNTTLILNTAIGIALGTALYVAFMQPMIAKYNQ